MRAHTFIITIRTLVRNWKMETIDGVTYQYTKYGEKYLKLYDGESSNASERYMNTGIQVILTVMLHPVQTGIIMHIFTCTTKL